MRVLFLTHRCPYAPNRGDRIRAYHLLQLLATRFDVDIVSLVHDADEQHAAGTLASRGFAVSTHRVSTWRNRVRAAAQLSSRQPLTHLLLDGRTIRDSLREIVRERRPDVVLAYCSGMARFALEPPLSDIPFVLDMVDVDSEKWSALSANAGPVKKWIYAREARCLRAFERDAAITARYALVVNERERDALRRIAPAAEILVSPNGVDLASFRPAGPVAREERVVFCGVMNYPPNVDAACWLAESVWPLVRQRRPHARLTLVGASPTPRVRRLATDPTVEVTGTVPDVRSYLWRSAVAAAPLRIARGIQNKVLEAVAAGLPVVTTTAVAEGLPEGVRPACRVARTPEAFAAALIGLLELTENQRAALAADADLRGLSWTARLTPVLDILQEAASTRRAAA